MRRVPLQRYRRAEQDLIEQFEYWLADGKPETAGNFLDAAERALERIAEHPLIGPLHETRNPRLAGVHKWPIPDFEEISIYYRPSDESIDVMRVLHSKRDIEAELESEE